MSFELLICYRGGNLRYGHFTKYIWGLQREWGFMTAIVWMQNKYLPIWKGI